MPGDLQPVGGGDRRDPQPLGDAAAPGHVGLQTCGRTRRRWALCQRRPSSSSVSASSTTGCACALAVRPSVVPRGQSTGGDSQSGGAVYLPPQSPPGNVSHVWPTDDSRRSRGTCAVRLWPRPVSKTAGTYCIECRAEIEEAILSVAYNLRNPAAVAESGALWMGGNCGRRRAR